MSIATGVASGATTGGVLTPTVRQSTRRLTFWLVLGGALLVLGVVFVALAGASTAEPPLSPDSATPDGAGAVVEVLRDEGVDVTVTAGLDETAEALAGASDSSGSAGTAGASGRATLLVHDVDDLLDDDRLASLLDLSDRIVLIDPDFAALRALAPGVQQAGTPDDDLLEAACSLPAAVASGKVSPGGSSYRIGDGRAAGAGGDGGAEVDDGSATGCLRSDSDDADPAFSLVQVETAGVEVVVLGATEAITNGAIDEAGNAAFALTLLGERERLVWYVPSRLDSAQTDVSAATPGWVTPLLLLLVVTAAAAALWRGRRFGPLIVEDLPVVVRSAETMEGRARLYQRSGARVHAADALRIGAIGRMAARLGLPGTADLDAVVLAIAELLETDARGIRSLLVDELPATDRELVALSDRLAALEADVGRRR